MLHSIIYKLLKFFQPFLTKRRQRIISFFLAFIFAFLIAKTLSEAFTQQIPVFGFHDIIDLPNSQEKNLKRPAFPGDYQGQDLAVFLEELVRQNYWFLSTQDLYDYFLANPKKPIPAEHRHQRKVMITFDDGYKSIYTHVLPLLKQLQTKYDRTIKVVVFINPAFLDRQGVWQSKVSCLDLRKGLKQGFYDVQSHGLNHENLTKIPPKALIRELSESQNQLRRCTWDLDPDRLVASHIAYPFGAVNQEVEKYLSQYYLSGYLYNSLTFKIGFFPPNRYHIPRLTVNKKHSVKKLVRLAAGGWLRQLTGIKL